MEDLVVVVDSRLWLPTELPTEFVRELKKGFTYANPDFFKRQATGYSTWNVDRQIRTWANREDRLGERFTLPRGGMSKLRDVAKRHDMRVRMMDRRTVAPVRFPRFCVDPAHPEWVLMPHQLEQVAVSLRRQQGVDRAPTGSGKTISALALIHEAGQRGLVIVRDGNLLKQWLEVAVGCLGLPRREIGIIRGGRKFQFGRRLTLALQQTLYSRLPQLRQALIDDPIGIVVLDEVQTLAARTFLEVTDVFPCKMLVGFSADETRKDGKEFLIYDAIGPVIHEIDRAEMEARGIILPVTVRVVPTEFRADWYRSAEPIERNFQQLIEEMTTDDDRNQVVVELLEQIGKDEHVPALVFTHRREHASYLADRVLPFRGLKCGLLIGGKGADGVRFEEDKARLQRGEVDLAIGTFNAIGMGINLPVVRAGVCVTPISVKNKQFFGQVRGRICRTAEGKLEAFLYYLWDREVFPNQLRALLRWNDGRVQEQDARGRWVAVTSAR